MLINHNQCKMYEVEGAGRIKVAWREFQPTAETAPTSRAIIFMPGWGYNEHAETIVPLCSAFADYSHDTTYAVDTRAEQIVPHTLIYEAEADRRFIQEKDFKNIVVVGSSLAGGQAVELVARLVERNPDIHIEGLILLDSVALYDQTVSEIISNFSQEMRNETVNLKRLPRLKDSKDIQTQNRQYLREGTLEIFNEMLRSHVLFPHRLLNEVREASKINPYLGDIAVPVVLVQGAYDRLSRPARIIPRQGRPRKPGRPYVKGIMQDIENEREKFLRNTLFHQSPYIRMIVPEKAGYHSLPSLRPQSVARSSLYLLKRYMRQQSLN